MKMTPLYVIAVVLINMISRIILKIITNNSENNITVMVTGIVSHFDVCVRYYIDNQRIWVYVSHGPLFSKY